MSHMLSLRQPLLTAVAGVLCVCPALAQEPVTELDSPRDMLAVWDAMCRNLSDSARVRISPKWGVPPKQAIGLTMQDLNADSYGCDYQPATGIVTIRPKYSSTAKLIAAHKTPALRSKLTPREIQALDKAESIVRELIKPGMGDYAKVLALHDYITAHARFTPPNGDDCVEMLLSGKGVCEGYARALRVLFTMAGVENQFAFGEAKNEKHLWNLVRVEGVTYHLDATWDDGMDGYGYFLLTDDELGADHRWNRKRFHATARAGRLYYKRSGLCPATYAELWKGVLAAWAAGKSEYQCYFRAYGSKDEFLGELDTFRRAHAQVRVCSWKSPDSNAGILCICFDRS